MSKREEPIHALERFLPEGTFSKIAIFFKQYDIHLTVTRERASVLGDYRSPLAGQSAHRISINGSLNPYSFLITLVHELAHMLAYIQYKRSIQPHGSEWKNIFSHLLANYMGQNIFPADVEEALQKSLNSPKASTCSDPNLYRALKRYDKNAAQVSLVEDIPLQQHFRTKDGRVFQKLAKMRTRFRCKEIATGHIYLFPALVEVKSIAI